MWREYWVGSGAGREIMWWSGNSKGIHISWWQGECRWRMWGCCSCQNKMWWVKFRECCELLCGRFPSKMKGVVYESYIRPTMLCKNEAWCLMESEMGILYWTERSMVRAACRVQLEDRRRCLCWAWVKLFISWYGHVLRREDGQVLRRVLDLEVEGQRMKGRTWRR